MTTIDSLKTYIKTYTGLDVLAVVFVDHLDDNPTNYAIIPIAGAQIIETYIDGTTIREFPFAFQSMESTADELERLETIGFYEGFAAWLETQSNMGVFPTLDAGKTARKIQALGWAYLYQEGQSSTGVYQIQCRLEYKQVPPP